MNATIPARLGLGLVCMAASRTRPGFVLGLLTSHLLGLLRLVSKVVADRFLRFQKVTAGVLLKKLEGQVEAVVVDGETGEVEASYDRDQRCPCWLGQVVAEVEPDFRTENVVSVRKIHFRWLRDMPSCVQVP